MLKARSAGPVQWRRHHRRRRERSSSPAARGHAGFKPLPPSYWPGRRRTLNHRDGEDRDPFSTPPRGRDIVSRRAPASGWIETLRDHMSSGASRTCTFARVKDRRTCALQRSSQKPYGQPSQGFCSARDSRFSRTWTHTRLI